MTEPPWWRGAVIYQIYPRSFADANGDGIGDLPGIIDRLNHVADLGVDAIWLSPIYASPMRDFGYDVSDYRAIHSAFGTLDDARRLIAAAHDHGLKVLLDFVPCHTSDQHAWFRDSRTGRDGPHADWYVWAEPRVDGTPPNNWLSVFGGPAWTWDPRRRQYYMHTFLAEQPALNHHNPAVTEAILAEARFWLESGVDGFRLDAINVCFHDALLRDNPPLVAPLDPGDTVDDSNPFAMQRHLYSHTRPEAIGLLKRFRALVDGYPGAVTIGEVASDDSLTTAAEYVRGDDRLHMAYTFNLLTGDGSAARVRYVVERLESMIGDGWPCWSFSNHDVVRAPSRWQPENAPAPLTKVLNALLLSLRGSVCLYQGEELGLAQAEVPFERIQDPAGRPFWPNYKGRDGCRTPMPWSGKGPFAGFSTAEPWLPVDTRHQALAVDRQSDDPESTLAATRRFLRWRRDKAVLRLGDIRFVDTPAPVLAFERSSGDSVMFCAFNPSGRAVDVPLKGMARWRPLDGHGFTAATVDGSGCTLPAYGAFFGMKEENTA